MGDSCGGGKTTKKVQSSLNTGLLGRSKRDDGVVKRFGGGGKTVRDLRRNFSDVNLFPNTAAHVRALSNMKGRNSRKRGAQAVRAQTVKFVRNAL